MLHQKIFDSTAVDSSDDEDEMDNLMRALAAKLTGIFSLKLRIV